MPLLDTQRTNAEIGRIRLGISEDTGKTTRGGKPITRPVKSGTFVFSSRNERVIRVAAHLFGGQAESWERGQWRVISEASEIPVSVPGGPNALSQSWEMWGDNICQRRCDGVTEQLRQEPCLCPEDPLVRSDLAKAGKACKAKTRINVLVPDLPGIGVWRLETGSWYAAIEIGGTIELLAAARDRGVIVPAVLRLEPRERQLVVDRGVRPSPREGIRGERVEVRKYYVPMLDVLPTLREMSALAQRPIAEALPPAPEQLKAISAGREATPAYGLPVAAPAAWTAEAAEEEPAPDSDPASPDAVVERTAQTVADAARTATTLDDWRALWEEARVKGWLDDYVSTDPDTPDAVMDTLKVHLTGQGARINEGL